MSAWQLSSFTEFVQVNTQANPGTILLPNAAALPGRILTFKDSQGTFSQNPLTLSTVQGNAFDDGATQKILRERFGFLEIASDGISRWNVLEGTQMPMYTISSLNVVAGFSTIAASTSQLTVSTLRLNDSILPNVQSNLYTSSSLLYCGGQIVGGTRVASGPTLLTAVTQPFVPTQIPFVALWLDGDDINTIRTAAAVVNWIDKSPNNRNATKATAFASVDPPVVNRGVNFSNTASLLKVANMPVAPYDVFIVGVADPTNTSWRTFLRTENVPGTHPLIIQTGANNVGMWSGSFSQFGSYTWVGNEQALFYISIASARTETASKNGDISLTAATPAGNESQITCIGNSSGGSQPAGIINELLIYSTTLAQDQRQLVEGYLAWKWGLVGRIPAAHPYKSRPPTAFSLINTPYFLSVLGGASLIFTWSYLLTSGTTNTGTNILIFTSAVTPVQVANTTPTLSASAFSLTSDGTTNATTGLLTANLTFGTSYLARVQINIPTATLSVFSQPFVYGAQALAATSPAFTATGATLGLSWTRNTTVTQPSNNTFIFFYTDAAGTATSISSTDRTTANTFSTDGTSSTGSLVSNLTFNTTYYFRVGTSNIVNTSNTLSAVSAGGLYGSTALAPSALGTPTGGATVSISWTRNSTNARPSNNTKVYFYTDVVGSNYGAESIDLGTASSFTTDGTVATGQMSTFTPLVFNTTYYLRVGTSNALTTGAYQNSAAVTGAVAFGAVPIAGTISSYIGGATMSATFGSTATLAQPISSSNVTFLLTDGTTVVATRTGYTGGNSYSSTGVAGDFTSGSLTFNTNYILRLSLSNALGLTNTLTSSQLFGAAPLAQPTSPAHGGSYTLVTIGTGKDAYQSATYRGVPVVINWVSPTGATLARPVSNIQIVLEQGLSSPFAYFTSNLSALTTTFSFDLSGTGSYPIFGSPYGATTNKFYLASSNALGTSGRVRDGLLYFTQYQTGYSGFFNVSSNSGNNVLNMSVSADGATINISGYAYATSKTLGFQVRIFILGGVGTKKSANYSWSCDDTPNPNNDPNVFTVGSYNMLGGRSRSGTLPAIYNNDIIYFDTTSEFFYDSDFNITITLV